MPETPLSPGFAMANAPIGYHWVGSDYTCDSVVLEGGYSYWNEELEKNIWVVPTLETNCTRVDYFAPDGTAVPTNWDPMDPYFPSSGGGESPPPAPPPPPPTPPSDTVCATTTRDANGALNWKPIQDSLNSILSEAISAGVEMGGIIWKEYPQGPYYFLRLPSPAATNCEWSYIGGEDAPGFIAAYFHTHLYANGATYRCPGDIEDRTATNLATGGGSVDASDSLKADWGMVRRTQKPMYVVDPDFIWRLDTGVGFGDEHLNTNQWNRVTGGCALP